MRKILKIFVCFIGIMISASTVSASKLEILSESEDYEKIVALADEIVSVTNGGPVEDPFEEGISVSDIDFDNALKEYIDTPLLTSELLSVSEVENALEQSLAMRQEAMDHLSAGGVVVLFPSGSVASSESWWGRAVEKEWNPFTAKMIAKSGATVLPIYFPGQNSRAYQIASHLSPTLRQGLLIHEVVHALNRPQAPVVGLPLTQAEIAQHGIHPRSFMVWLRERTLSLGN